MNQKIEKGITLTAMPTLLDPNFRQTVVLLCEHSTEGSMGLVINRPTEVEVSALVDDFPALAQSGCVYTGGPVSRNAMLVLCRGTDTMNGYRIREDIFLARDLDTFKDPEIRFQDKKIRCYLGYAGWGPGQLEGELRSGAWAIMEGRSPLVFESDTALLWQTMMKRMGGEFSVYASIPPDPTSN